MVNENNNECPKGYTRRKSYRRKFKNAILRNGYSVTRKGKKYHVVPQKESAHVESVCAKDRVQESKAPLRKGELLKYGYVFYKSDSKRHDALDIATKHYGARRVFDRLSVASRLFAKSYPAATKVFKIDKKWIQNKYLRN